MEFKMKKMVLFSLLILSFVFTAVSQDLFTVVSSKSVLIKKGGSWVNLAVGTKLSPDDVIKASQGGAASFLHAGKVVKFAQTSEIKAGDFQKSALSGSGNLTSDLINATNSKLDSKKKVSTTVGGFRATETVGKDVFLITPRRGTKFYNSLPLFTWNHVNNESEYQLVILTEDLNQVKNVQTKDTIYQYSQKDPELEKGVTYVCFVKPLKSNRNSEYQTFTVVTDSEANEIKKKLDVTEKVISEADNVAKSVIRGSVYEELGLYTDAYKFYKEAINMAPDEKAYRKMCADLLWKVNLIKQITYLSGYTSEK
jgi:hypothetical protein